MVRRGDLVTLSKRHHTQISKLRGFFDQERGFRHPFKKAPFTDSQVKRPFWLGGGFSHPFKIVPYTDSQVKGPFLVRKGI